MRISIDEMYKSIQDILDSPFLHVGYRLSNPGHPIQIVYTSGTTGEPKGVMLSQRNIVTNVLGVLEEFGGEEGDLRLCFLPLSHIFARIADLYTWIGHGSQ